MRGKGDHDLALADYSETIRLNPQHAVAYASRGSVYAWKDEQDKAIADFTEALRLDAKFAYAYCCRGVAYANKGSYERTIADCSEAIRLDAKFAQAYLNRGLAYDNLGEKSKASADFAKAKGLGYQGSGTEPRSVAASGAAAEVAANVDINEIEQYVQISGAPRNALWWRSSRPTIRPPRTFSPITETGRDYRRRQPR